METTKTQNNYIEELIESLKKNIKFYNGLLSSQEPKATLEDENCICGFAREFLLQLAPERLLNIYEKEINGFDVFLRKVLSRSIAAHLLEDKHLFIFNPDNYEAYICNYNLTKLVRIIKGDNKKDLQKINFDLHGKFGRKCAISLKYVENNYYS